MMSISCGAWHPSSRGARGMQIRHCQVPQQPQFPPWSCGHARSLGPSLPDASHADQHN